MHREKLNKMGRKIKVRDEVDKITLRTRGTKKNDTCLKIESLKVAAAG